MNQVDMFSEIPNCTTEEDLIRLSNQLARVYEFMKDGNWYTIEEVNTYAGGTHSCTSAHMRSLRKSKYGNHVVEREYHGNGLYKYRLIPNENKDMLLEIE